MGVRVNNCLRHLLTLLPITLGGTADFVSYGVKSRPGSNATVEVEIVGDPQGMTANSGVIGSYLLTTVSGALCGAFRVNAQFKKWVEGNTPNLKKLCESLGLSTKTFLRRASYAFEAEKLRFSSARQYVQRIRLPVDGAIDALRDTYDIVITGFVHVQAS
jgi:hypothetical protein